MSEQPAHHTANGFRNPWDSASPPTWPEVIASPLPLEWARGQFRQHPEAKNLEVKKPDWGDTSGKDNLKATWLGHASVLVELPALNPRSAVPTIKILFDPIFSPRAGPTQYTGPSRILPPPCRINELPGCDVVCISHNQ